MVNPARFSAAVGGLFPPAVIACELREAVDPALLWPEEARHLSSAAVPKRVQEFVAGRLCARRALAELGIVDFPIRVAADRQPCWPAQAVGSITHTAGFCAAVVAARDRILALGLDTEVGTLESGKWADLCCVDLSGPATQPLRDPVTQLVFGGGRDIVSDVWVAGRQLLSEGELTRLDWAAVADRTQAWASRLTTGV